MHIWAALTRLSGLEEGRKGGGGGRSRRRKRKERTERESEKAQVAGNGEELKREMGSNVHK